VVDVNAVVVVLEVVDVGNGAVVEGDLEVEGVSVVGIEVVDE
jgi:hypothetical protein